MKDRLTGKIRNFDGSASSIKPIADDKGFPNKFGSDVLTKLADYEDLEEQGSLIKLPCKVGDTVYVKMALYCNVLYAEAKVRDFTHFTSCGFCVVVTSNHFDKQNIPFTEFGKTVFLAKSEAEAKLKELKGE